MIRYRMVCAEGHDFDAWFRSADDCDGQVARGLVACGTCGSHEVKKALMAPQVRTSKKKEVAPAIVDESASSEEMPSTDTPMPVATMPPDKTKLVAAMRELRKKVTENADYVGPRFPEEARKIHFGETEARGIYGEASPDDVKSLTEDGVDILPLPVLPEERN